ncbi:Hint domain-containing protein [Rhodobacteraceae bacterium]|nr:Hint domain-containing protein [Paracoccaceae bacterium]
MPFSATGGTVTIPFGGTFTYLNIQTVTTEPLPCFAVGTRIKTDRGEVLVETITAGDMVETKDHGLQPVRFIGQRTVAGKGRFAPIAFAPGAIGNTQQLLLSPQHRVLVNHWRAELLFGNSEVLSPAKHLINGDTIKTAPVDEVTYVHLLFDHHEIILSDGAWTESFHPGEASLDGFGAETREEILTLFPELADPAYCKRLHSARLCLKAFEAKTLFGDQNRRRQPDGQDIAPAHQGAIADISSPSPKTSHAQ